jgi:predicted membrane-bound mannosyltransferase
VKEPAGLDRKSATMLIHRLLPAVIAALTVSACVIDGRDGTSRTVTSARAAAPEGTAAVAAQGAVNVDIAVGAPGPVRI